jgi:hypothetical protein
MSKIYVFAIGGTGSRVLRSLTMLLASGVTMQNNPTIVPIIIDPDENSGDLQRTKDIIDRYIALRSQIEFNAGTKNQFFSTPIEYCLNNTLAKKDILFKINNIGNGIPFKKYIDLEGMKDNLGNYDANHALTSLLFSENNLAENMTVGFKGNPNVGSVVLNQFKDSIQFKAFANNFAAGDRIFIISSIFGGTGASGFPILVKNIRSIDPQIPQADDIKKSKIGAITVMPYFNLTINNQSTIKATTFISKTKAALSYYDKNIRGNNSVNAMYYIGDTITNTYNNEEGGQAQKNDAHFIELVSALSIIDFANTPDTILTGNVKEKKFGIKNFTDGQGIIFNDLYNNTKEIIEIPLSQFMLLERYNKYCKFTPKETKQAWYKSARYKEIQAFIQNIGVFLDNYKEWLKEMASNNVRFTPFNNLNKGKDGVDNDHLFEFVSGVKPIGMKSLTYGNKYNFDIYDTMLNDYVNKIKGYNSTATDFVELFYNVTKQLLEKKLNMK